MVMEETPNPQCVGREFVRQYYTMLNKAPIQMHRFYSESSSFVHGGMGNGESVAVYGQQQIHARIMQLQYRDCHAKIRQVDSHSTLSNGVVVQVSGELSNNGMAMRKFMQTFVLAPLAPKNYYVHNDIFMYQDEVFSDEETPEDTNQTEVEQESPSQIKVEEITVNNESPDNSINAETTEDISGVGSWAAEDSVMTGGVGSGEEAVVAPVSHQTMIHDVTDSPPLSPPPDMQPNLPHDTQEQKQDQQGEIMTNISDGALDYETAMEPEPEPSEIKQPVIAEPKTFAERVKAGNMANFTAPQNNQTSPFVTTQSIRSDGFPGQQPAARVHRPRPATQPQRGPQPEPVRGGEPRYRGYEEGNRDSGGGEYGRRSVGGSSGPPGGGGSTGGGPSISQMYNDRQQVFVGNLPLSVTEEDLKAVFEKFGRIVDCHINNKPKPSLSSGQKPPNFGFVIFDEVTSVQKVLESPTLYLGSNRLNVEEKKTRTVTRPPSMDGRLGGNRGGGLPQRAAGGGRGGHRGGRGAPANRGSYNNQRIK